MSTSTSPRIAIVGGGPAGLTCARLLTNAGIPVKVFERDASPEARSQGGTLDLHDQGGGLTAIKEAGLLPQFQANCRTEGEDTVVADKHGHRLLSMVDVDTGRPEIDRLLLRQILLDSLPEGTVRWNSNLKSAEKGTLHFEHGTEGEFDLIVGAEGAWSKVRSLLTPIQPFYSGISGVEIRLRNVDAKYPEIANSVGRGQYYAWGGENGRCCISQRQGDGSVRIYVFMKKPEEWVQEFRPLCKYPGTAREAILEELSDWANEFREWVANCDDDIIPRALYMLPVGLKWPNQPGVTVVGDAAHLMTPFAGEGVNVAMSDGLKLAKCIIDNQSNLNKAVQDYEGWMFPASREWTQMTWDNMQSVFDYGAPQFAAKGFQWSAEQYGSQQTKESDTTTAASS